MKIGIASDHRGVILKEKIKNYLNSKYQIIDYGTNSIESVDYPQYAYKIGEAVHDKKIDLGILICGTGIGMSIACNKVRNVRCARVCNVQDAFATRNDNDANVIALSGRVPFEQAKDIVHTFLTTPFEQIERYQRRVRDINQYDN